MKRIITLLLGLVAGSAVVAQDATRPKAGVAVNVPLPPRTADGSDRLKQFQSELEALKKARSEAAASGATGSDATQEERAKLKTQLNELIERLKAREAAPPVPPPAPADAAKSESTDSTRTIDRLRLVHNLLRVGENQAALRALQLIEPATLNPKEAILVQYLKASCYRRLGQLGKAKEIYGGIAGSKEDAFLAECAAWQLRSVEMREGSAMRADTTAAKGSSK